MNRVLRSLFHPTLLTLAMLASPAVAETPPPAKPDGGESLAETQKKMSQPGQKHRLLEPLAGDWKAHLAYWPSASAEQPLEAGGTAASELLMGGRYLRLELETNLGGMPYEVLVLLGYDGLEEHFWGTWVDSLGTALATMKGQAEDGGEVLTLHGQWMDASRRTIRSRSRIERTSDREFVMEIYNAAPQADEFKSLAIRFSRE